MLLVQASWTALRYAWARQIYDIYAPMFAEEKVEGIYRVDLPSFEMFRYLALRGFLEDPFYPKNMQDNLRSRIANERPELLKKLGKQEGAFLNKIEKLKKEQEQKE